MEVNSISHFWTIKTFMPKMIEKNNGYLVTISSVAGVIGTPGMSDYSASKFACFALTESVRMELQLLGKKGVDTLTVCPYFMKTPMFSEAKSAWPWLFPILDPEEVADRIITSMKRRDGILMMPAFSYFAFLCRFVFPTWVQDFFTLQLGGAINYNK
jgi:all-trans-retinol dehydrogenase (NAD+)